MSGTEKTHKTIYIVFISLILDLLGFTVILPLFPSLLDHYGQTDKGGLYHTVDNYVSGFRELVGAPNTLKYNSVLFGGALGSLFSFLQFVSGPLVGAASDNYGRRPIMLLSLVGISLSYVVWALSSNFTLFVLARILGGVSKGNVNLSVAIVTDLSTEKNRGKGMALVGIAFSIGFLLGPSIGAYFARMAVSSGNIYVMPALFALTFSLLNLLFVYFFLEESLPSNKRAKSLGSSFSEGKNFISPISLFLFSAVKNTSTKDLASLRQIGLSYFLYLLIYSGLEFTLTFLVHMKFDYTSKQQGMMFLYTGLLMMLFQGGYVRRIPAGSEKKHALLGIIILIPSFILVGTAQSQTMLFAGLFLYSYASAVVVSCMTTMISKYGGDSQKGTVLGIFRSLGSLARAFGPILASTVYWSFGANVCYISGGMAVIFPLLILKKVTLKISQQ